MIWAFDLAMLAVSLVALAPALFYACVVVAGVFAANKPVNRTEPGPITVIVPAHDEEAGIARTVGDLAAQLRPRDRLLVVADNCSDQTAALAAGAGAAVVERRDSARRGKGYALQFGLDSMRADPPEIVLFVDADCRVEHGGVFTLAAIAAATQRPVQALNLMTAPAGASPRLAVAEFAWILINKVRQAGLFALFGAARLTGTGMALPWKLLAERDLASGEIVEDLALGLDLTQAGAPPIYSSDAVVRSEFPASAAAAAHQRARWEHGSMRLAARRAPTILFEALSKGDMRLAALTLDAMIPPLTIFIAALAGLFLLSLAAAFIGAASAAPVAGGALALALLSTLLAWAMHGREALPLSALGAVASFLVGKAAVYGRDARASTKVWTRTDRGDGEQAKP